jgi:RNA polymerase sigma-70 factor, ECF subfamily
MNVPNAIDGIYRAHSRQVFATLVRLLGGFDLAEDALHEAFRAAIERWPLQGVPANPVAWLVSAGRFKAIDQLRRQRLFTPLDDVIEQVEAIADERAAEDDPLEDDRLRLIFTCCHPSLAQDAQIALTLREVCGLSTEEIARAFLLPAPTLAQRIVRAKAKIRDAKIPYEVPEAQALPERLSPVLRVIYLVFNEGYSASAGHSLTRHDLSQEAIRLARLVHGLLPQPEVAGLLALMLLHESRRSARSDAQGDLIALDEQDRSLWDADLISEGSALAVQALRAGVGSYSLQAAIAAIHAEASDTNSTDWPQIVGLYDALLRVEPSPVVALNRAVAVAMSGDLAHGLRLVDELMQDESMQRYHLAHAARADLCRRLNRPADARAAYETALSLARQEPEKRLLKKRLAELSL